MTIPTSLDIEARYATGAPIALALILAAAPHLRAGDPDAAAAAVEAALPADISGPGGSPMWAVGFGMPPAWGAAINYPAVLAHDEAHPELALSDFGGAYEISQRYALPELRAASERAGRNTAAPEWRSAATRRTVAARVVADIATYALCWS